jgi:AMP-binding enzyme
MTLLTLIYTSGTTGPPKGVELTHANVMATVAGATERLRFTPGMRAISWLPMAHIAERLCANYVAITHGWQVTTCADPRAVGALLPEVRPQFLWTRHLPREVRTVEVAATMDCDQAVLEIVGSTPQGLQAIHAKRTTTDHPAREDAVPRCCGKPMRARCSECACSLGSASDGSACSGSIRIDFDVDWIPSRSGGGQDAVTYV